jgi:hypothetical protein
MEENLNRMHYRPEWARQPLWMVFAGLREFRATRPAHDLSVLRRRDDPTPNIEQEPEPMPVEPKKRKSKRPVESEE